MSIKSWDGACSFWGASLLLPDTAARAFAAAAARLAAIRRERRRCDYLHVYVLLLGLFIILSDIHGRGTGYGFAVF
jgi:hypothetical protein